MLSSRYYVYYATLGLTALVLVLGATVQSHLLWLLPVVAPLALLGTWDLVQTRHSVLRNYPILAHMRFLCEGIRPELRQYFFESNLSGTPFSREQRTLVYERAKNQEAKMPFGTELDLYAPEAYAAAVSDAAKAGDVAVVLVPGTAMGRDVAARAAARLESVCATDLIEVKVEADGTLRGQRPVYSGKALARVAIRGARPAFATLRPNVFDPAEPDPSRTAEVTPLELSVPILAGGLIAHGATRRAGGAEPAQRAGTLFAAGLITGEALMGIFIAIPIVMAGRADVIALGEGLQFGGWLGLTMLAGVALLMYRTVSWLGVA